MSVNAPIAASHKKYLAEKYTDLASSGSDDAAIQSQLDANLSGIVLYDQIDCDHSGSISRKEVSVARSTQ